MSDNGWIKLHRKLLDNPIMLNAELLQLFIYCLLKANHKDKEFIFNGKLTMIKTGYFITGREQMAKELKQKESTIYKRLKALKKLGYISLESNNKFTVLHIEKYSTYQIEKLSGEQQSNNKRTTKEQQGNTNNNDKNEKNEKKYRGVADFPSLDTEAFKEAWVNWQAHRAEIRHKLTPSTTAKQLEFLSKQPDPVACINRSIQNGWQGLFEYGKPDKAKDKDSKPHLFIDSAYYEQTKFIEHFYSNLNYRKYDAGYYYEAVRLWSEQNHAKKVNWIATAYNFARRDKEPKLNKSHAFPK